MPGPSRKIPRPEHPRPQFTRTTWANLNGRWTFEIDSGRSGHDRGYPRSEGFSDAIEVPFCPESALSGVGHTDFIESMWYHRPLAIPGDWAGMKIILHFGGVDYYSEVFIDGTLAGRHWGGMSSFSHDITLLVKPGRTHNLVVAVRDDVRQGLQPRGKQCPSFHSHGCLYTRTTGIWQTVWMEAVDARGLDRCTVTNSADGSLVTIAPRFHGLESGQMFKATVSDNGRIVATAIAPAHQGMPMQIPITSPELWSPENPFLYELAFETTDRDGCVVDTVQSYTGLRTVAVEGDRLLVNGEPRYLRFVLDQGFYPDGIWTAPSDEALKHDIELSMAAGFNGARLHQKVFEERFHYWADRLGYLTWAESSDWGLDMTNPVASRNFLAEWRAIVVRDRNHPSIIAWTPFNETAKAGGTPEHTRLVTDVYDLTHDLDPTRPVNDTSGYVHVKTDLWTVHTYEQDPARLSEQLRQSNADGVFRNYPDREAAYAGQPYFVDEFGGIKWVPSDTAEFSPKSWGYGGTPANIDEFYDRLERQVEAILSAPHIRGYCYTQLTDVEQEQNGVYMYDRSVKFNMDRIAAIFSRSPALQPRQSEVDTAAVTMA